MATKALIDMLVYTLREFQAKAVPKKVDNKKILALEETLDDTLAVVETKTVGVTLGNVNAEALA